METYTVCRDLEEYMLIPVVCVMRHWKGEINTYFFLKF